MADRAACDGWRALRLVDVPRRARTFVTRKLGIKKMCLLAYFLTSGRLAGCSANAIPRRPFGAGEQEWLASSSTRIIFAAGRLLHREQAEKVEAVWKTF